MRGNQREALIVLPTYDEIATLAGVVGQLRARVPEADLLIIDDGSPDGTGALAERLAAGDPAVSVLHRPGKQGLGTAYVHGFRRALAEGYRFVVEMDSDGSHLPEELPRLLAAARGGADLVIGARWIPGGAIVNWPGYRRLISRTGTAVARIALRSRLRDLTSGFRVLSARALRLLDLDAVDSEGYAFQVESAWLLERAGAVIAEEPITFVERSDGRSKMTLGIVAEALANVLRWGWELRAGERRDHRNRRNRRERQERRGPRARRRRAP